MIVLVAVSIIALQLLRLSKVVFWSDTIIELRALQYDKIFQLIFVTFSGIVILVRAVQFVKAYGPISCTLSGIVITDSD